MPKILRSNYLLLFMIFSTHALYVSDQVSNKTLTRRKRYLVFPEGSSFQLVYCLTLPTYGMGQIFTIGLTAALAWELPNEPILFNKNKEPTSERLDVPANNVNPPTYASTVSQYHKPWSAGAWTMYTKPITQYSVPNSRTEPFKVSSFQQPQVYEGENDLPAYRDHKKYYEHYEVHRRTRRQLFEKIEKFFAAQRKDGRACLLKAICEVNRTGTAKGTFVQEILKAIFTWKVDDDNLYEEDDHYNMAVRNDINCTELYPSCSHSIWNTFF